MNSKALITIGIATILFAGAFSFVGISSAETYDCNVTVNGKGCIIAQKAKDDIKNTININVQGYTGGQPPGGNGSTVDLEPIKSSIQALKAEQTTQNNDITDLKNKDVSQDQNVSKLHTDISNLQEENRQLRNDVDTLMASFEDFKNNGTSIVVLPSNETGNGGNTTNPEPPVVVPPEGNTTIPIDNGTVIVPPIVNASEPIENQTGFNSTEPSGQG